MADDPKKTDEATADDDPKAAERERLMSFYKQPSAASGLQADTKKKGELTQEDRIAGLIEECQKRAPPQLAQFLQQAGPLLVPFISVFITVFNFVAPLYFAMIKYTYIFLTWLPWDLFQATLGIGLCFFGGGYCATIAAAEAFALTGWPVTKRHLTEVYEAGVVVWEAHEADEKKDDDGDGVVDVKQISSSALVDRKVRVVASAVKEPQKLAAALGGLYTGWLAVQGVLRIKFAKTVNLAVSCSQFVEYYVTKALLPFLSSFVAREFVHWLPTGLSIATRGVFVWLAWKLQEIVSAAQSGMRGGLMFSRGLLRFANKRGLKSIFGLSLEEDSTYLDEAVGFFVAALGFYCQWNLGFAMPFPLNVFMMPVDLTEWYIRWSVTSTGGTVQD